jgi:hypothetical protein
MLNISWKAAPLKCRKRITVGIADPGTYGTWKAKRLCIHIVLGRSLLVCEERRRTL